MKVWAFNPGYVVTNFRGKGELEREGEERRKRVVGDTKESAKALVDVVIGVRDEGVGEVCS